MKYRIIRWLLGIWLVETVAARHIQNGEDTGSARTRNGRDEFHPFYPEQSSHSNLNSFRSSMRARPPQIPGRRNYDEQEAANGASFYSYFAADQPSQNAQNLYSAVRLHGALETRARNEPGSNTFSTSAYHHQPEKEARKVPQRGWRRDDTEDDSRIDGDSYERSDDLARFSLYNSYFDNEHSIKALNSMKCVTPTGSPGFCSTFKGCVPSFFTTTGELEAPALAELISTSIGYCTTNQSHHFIREQKQLAGSGSREDRRFDSVANRIICCPGVAPVRDPNEDPDKIFNDYIENQKKRTTTTTTTTETPSAPQEDQTGHESADSPANEPDAQPAAPQQVNPEVPVVAPEENVVNDGQGDNQDQSQSVSDAPETQQPVEISTVEATTAQLPNSSSMYPQQSQSNEPSSMYPVENQSGSSTMYPEQTQPNGHQSMYPDQSQSSEPTSMYPVENQSGSATMYPEQTQPSGNPSMYPDQPQSSEPTSMYPDENGSVSPIMYPEQTQPSGPSSMYPSENQTGSESVDASVQDQAQTSQPPIYPSESISENGVSMYPDNTVEHQPTTGQPQQSQGENTSYPANVPQGSDSGNLDGSKPSDAMAYPEDNTIGQQNDEQSSSSSSMAYPETTTASVSQPVEETSQGIVQHDKVNPTEAGSQPTSDTAPHQEESVAQEVSSSSPTNEQPESASEVPSTPPGTERPSPGKLPQQSNIIKIHPEPVSGVNGKFTLPGGIYIVSTSTDMPANNQPNPVPPSGGSSPDEAVGGSKPIIIVTNPSDMFPNFPGDFPPIGSQEVLPIDDSSLELQQRPVSQPVLPAHDDAPTNDAPASMYPSSSTASSVPESPQTTQESQPLNDEQAQPEVTTSGPMSYPASPQEATTIALQQVETVVGTTASSISAGNLAEEIASDATTLPPPQLIAQDTTADSEISVVQTTRKPLQDDSDDDALTIVPINPSSSTTPSPVPAVVESSSQPTVGQEQVDTASSATLVEGQESEATTSVPAASSQEIGLLEATTTAPEDIPLQQVSTVLPESDESEESEEVGRVTNRPAEEESADIIKTTPSPVVSSGDVSAPTALPAADAAGDIGLDEESLPETTSSPLQNGQNIGAATNEMVYPPSSEPEMQYTTSQPSPSMDSATENTVPPKIILNPGSESNSEHNEASASESGPEPVKQNDDVQDGELVPETVQPFPATSPASTGDAGGSEQQPFPGEASNDQIQTTVSSAISNDQPSAVSGGGEGDESDSGTELPSVPSASNESPSSTYSPSEQFAESSDASSSSESPSATNIGDAAGVPTTSAPVSHDGEQDHILESNGVIGGDATSSPTNQHSSPDGTDGADSSSVLSTGGNEPVTTTSQPSGVSGGEPLPIGSESPSGGNESAIIGSESSLGGSDPSSSGDASQNDDPTSTGSESTAPESVAAPTEPAATQSSQSSDAPTQAGELPTAELVASPTNEAAPTEQPTLLPSHDESSPDHSNDAVNEPAATSSTLPPANAGGSVEAESVSQDNVSSIPSDAPESSSPVQEQSTQSNSPVSSDNLQDSQSSIPTTEVPQSVSSSAPVETTSMSAMYQSSSTAPTEPSLKPEEITPNYQILKACKFQSFFRSVNDQTYSYRHYPWLATIVGGTRPFSSGTLITDRHILTASHFLANITVSDVFNMRIHVGYRTSYSGQTEGPYAVRKVRKVIRHKGFSFEKLYNDIAVLVLDRPVRFSEDIYPVCISSNRTAYADGTSEAFETGWVEDPRTYTISQHHNYVDPHIQKYFSFGYKNITWRLQEASQRVRTNQECQSNYSFLEKNGILVTDSMVCAGSGDTRSCGFRGNSGAPLFLRNENDRMTEQIGIVSFGIGCGHFPFVFTRVESFLPWLDRVVYNSR